MQKPKTYEHIEEMSAKFAEWQLTPSGINTGVAVIWQLRIQLAIAQQLSVIVAALKERGGDGQ